LSEVPSERTVTHAEVLKALETIMAATSLRN